MEHQPVLLDRAIELLDVKSDGIYVDATVGGGGHALEIARRLSVSGRLIGIDLDRDALEIAATQLKPFSEWVTLIHGNFAELDRLLDRVGVDRVDGILFDLGLSSMQLDTPERGFSFRFDAKLDMRMDPNGNPLTAEEVINTDSQAELERVFRESGETRWGKRIAEAIVKTRKTERIETTGQLVETVKSAIPTGYQRNMNIHPATKIFQALRIIVNNELTNLRRGIIIGSHCLKVGGVIVVIAYHSLEDRIVKGIFVEQASDCICPPEWPVCRCDKEREGEILTKRPIQPDAEQVACNPRSRSARLRAIRKLIG
ncbi:MAG: 16S rRNA (cytosine(1402)-N(4))-methyltransferase RsmH [Candidatus Bipolaricaulia bacterium]